MKNDPSIAHSPYPCDEKTAYAFQGLQAGTATPDQQTMVLKWIIECSGAYNLSYRPEDINATNFAEGKRFVGLQIIKLLNINPTVLKEK